MKKPRMSTRGSHGQKLLGVETKTPAYAQAEDEGPNAPLYPPKLRDCRRCGVQTHNYFTCYRCQCQIQGRNPDAYAASEFMSAYADRTPYGLGIVTVPGRSGGQR